MTVSAQATAETSDSTAAQVGGRICCVHQATSPQVQAVQVSRSQDRTGSCPAIWAAVEVDAAAGPSTALPVLTN